MKITKEEAIKIIEEAFETWKSEFGEGDWEKEDEALSMAISALEKENIYDDKEHYVTISRALYDKLNVDACDDVISRNWAIHTSRPEYVDASTVGSQEKADGWNEAVAYYKEQLEKAPSVQPKSVECDDVISREHLLSEIGELKKSPWFNNGKDDKDFHRAMYIERKEAVEVIENICVRTEPSVQSKPIECDDCVSREAVIYLVSDMRGLCRNDVLNDTLNKIQYLPSVEPSRKGYWIPNEYFYGIYDYTCSNCKKNSKERSDYCKKCGADMRGIKK